MTISNILSNQYFVPKQFDKTPKNYFVIINDIKWVRLSVFVATLYNYTIAFYTKRSIEIVCINRRYCAITQCDQEHKELKRKIIKEIMTSKPLTQTYDPDIENGVHEKLGTNPKVPILGFVCTI